MASRNVMTWPEHRVPKVGDLQNGKLGFVRTGVELKPERMLHEDVGELQISVDNLLRLNVCKAAAHFRQHVPQEWFRRGGGAHFTHVVLEITYLAVLENSACPVFPAGMTEKIEELNNVPVLSDVLQNANLRRGNAAMSVDDCFYGHKILFLYILAQVDRAVALMADVLQQLIALGGRHVEALIWSAGGWKWAKTLDKAVEAIAC